MTQLFPGCELQGKREKAEEGVEEREGCAGSKEVKRAGKRWKELWTEWAFCGGGCDGFVGHVSPGCQGAPVWWYREGGEETRSAEKEEEEEAGVKKRKKQGLIQPPLFLTQTQTPSNPFYQKSR